MLLLSEARRRREDGWKEGKKRKSVSVRAVEFENRGCLCAFFGSSGCFRRGGLGNDLVLEFPWVLRGTGLMSSSSVDDDDDGGDDGVMMHKGARVGSYLVMMVVVASGLDWPLDF